MTVLGPLALDLDPDTASAAVRGLRYAGPPAAPALAVAAVHSLNEDASALAEEALLAMGIPAVGPLIDQFSEKNAGAHLTFLIRLDRYWDRHASPNPAFNAVREEWQQDRELRSQLAVLRNSGDLDEVWRAYEWFGHRKPWNVVAPRLTARWLKSLPEKHRVDLLRALGRRKSLVEMLGSVGGELEKDVLHALASMGEGGVTAFRNLPEGTQRQVVPVLVRHLENPRNLEFWIPEAIAQVGPGAVPALVEYFDRVKQDEWRRAGAVRALILMGPATANVLGGLGEPALWTLLRHLEDADRPTERATAAAALGKMGKIAASAVPALTKAPNDPDESVRSAARSALAEIGQK